MSPTPSVTSAVAYDVVGEPGVHTGMPSTSITLVLAVDEPLDVGWVDGPRTRAAATVAGLHTAPAEIRHGRRQAGVHVALSPLGVHRLLGVPAAALRGEIVEVGDVDRRLRDLAARVDGAPPGARRALVLAALGEAAAHREEPVARPEVARALARLTRGARVADVAAEVGLSRRRLQDLVRAEVGVTPKEWARLARFERSHRSLAAQAPTGRTDLAGLAAEVGYADQAHLARDWRALAGCAPTAWLAREFPNVQADTAGAVAG